VPRDKFHFEKFKIDFATADITRMAYVAGINSKIDEKYKDEEKEAIFWKACEQRILECVPELLSKKPKEAL